MLDLMSSFRQRGGRDVEDDEVDCELATLSRLHLLCVWLLSRERAPFLLQRAAMALFFFSGTLIYVTVLLTNAIAILSEERFLAKSKRKLCQRVDYY